MRHTAGACYECGARVLMARPRKRCPACRQRAQAANKLRWVRTKRGTIAPETDRDLSPAAIERILARLDLEQRHARKARLETPEGWK
jgi:hypothetical protein